MKTAKLVRFGRSRQHRDAYRVFGCLLLVTLALTGFAMRTVTIEEATSSLVANDSFLMQTFGPPLPDRGQRPLLEVSVLLEGLKSPDGLAIDPYTGSIYISEEDASRILRLDADGTRRLVIDASTPVLERRGDRLIRVEGMQSPEGLAFERTGHLYVVEDIPGGRLLRFELPEYHRGGAIGEVIPMPQPGPDYSWESVAVGPRGELLLAGSNMEAFFSRRNFAGLYSGAVLYRDANGQWWMPVHNLLDSFSAVAFDPEGVAAYFASEMHGTVGCFSLDSRSLKVWYADQVIESPEGIAALPDGTAVIASESGKLYRMDPHDCILNEIIDLGSTIESVAWDGARNRLLVTADGSSSLLAVGPIYFNPSCKVQGPLYFDESIFEIEIPEESPSYLTGLLAMSGYDELSAREKVSFPQFVRNTGMIAMDGRTRLLPKSDPVEDPITHIQFVIFTPQLFGVTLSGIVSPVSGFIAVHESGAVTQTKLFSRRGMHVDLVDLQFTVFNTQRLALPHPFAYRVNRSGSLLITFMGFGETADYHIVVNMREPEHAYLVAMHADGHYQEYALELPPGMDLNHWVVGLRYGPNDHWARLETGAAGQEAAVAATFR
ncbi:MAG TPA: hypothetical protein PKE26_03560 [Kiritimatiellia bacterium]|nr:hypothetical protein [Kiritimatiellia bacterium]HMO98167.1 hypothetical protein [Kiritimatiellia bacterium]HMP96679.1 hypothetical protein [Kiritimatiellia bacterium]